MVAGESATGLSATDACLFHVVMADGGVTVRPIRAIVQENLYLGRVARLKPLREPRTLSIFELGLVLSRTSRCASIKGNADFGWAVALWSRGLDQVCADKEAMMATGTVKWFNP